MPSVSKSQQRLFGAVHSCQKTGKCASDKIKKIAKKISKKDAKDFAKTKHKGLPNRKLKKFKEWIEDAHPDFSLEENILGTLGNIALGAAAMAKTAIKDKNSYRQSVGDMRRGQITDNDLKKGDINTTNFLNQKWNWNHIFNYKTRSGVKILDFYYPSGSEEVPENLVVVNSMDFQKLKNQLKIPNKEDKIVGLNNWIKDSNKNRKYWHDGHINKFYEILRQENVSPKQFGGKDVRKEKAIGSQQPAQQQPAQQQPARQQPAQQQPAQQQPAQQQPAQQQPAQQQPAQQQPAQPRRS